jgi:hypothetical protein
VDPRSLVAFEKGKILLSLIGIESRMAVIEDKHILLSIVSTFPSEMEMRSLRMFRSFKMRSLGYIETSGPLRSDAM